MATVIQRQSAADLRSRNIGRGLQDAAGSIAGLIEKRREEERKKKTAAVLREALGDDEVSVADVVETAMSDGGDAREALAIADIVLSSRKEKREAEARTRERAEDVAQSEREIRLRGQEGRKTQKEGSKQRLAVEKELIPERAAATGAERRETATFEAELEERIRTVRQEERQSAMDEVAAVLEDAGQTVAAGVVRSIGGVEPGLASTTLQTLSSGQGSKRSVRGRDIEVFRLDDQGKVESRKVTLEPGEATDAFETEERFEDLREEGFSLTEPAEREQPGEMKKFQADLSNAMKRTGLPEAEASFILDNERAITDDIIGFYGRFDPETKKLTFFESRIGELKARQSLRAVPALVKKLGEAGKSITLPSVVAQVTKMADNAWLRGTVIPQEMHTKSGPGAAKQIRGHLTTNLGLSINLAEEYMEDLIGRGVLDITVEDMNPSSN